MGVKLKCTRCGLCCLSFPCFLVPMGEEIINEDGFHLCKELSFNKSGIAFCNLYKELKPNGICSSNKKDSYKNNIQLLNLKKQLVERGYS